jgi:hypothetical protein
MAPLTSGMKFQPWPCLHAAAGDAVIELTRRKLLNTGHTLVVISVPLSPLCTSVVKLCGSRYYFTPIPLHPLHTSEEPEEE